MKNKKNLIEKKALKGVDKSSIISLVLATIPFLLQLFNHIVCMNSDESGCGDVSILFTLGFLIIVGVPICFISIHLAIKSIRKNPRNILPFLSLSLTIITWILLFNTFSLEELSGVIGFFIFLGIIDIVYNWAK